MITFAIVCLNSEKTIEVTIRSILKAITNEDEIIIIDGASKDKTLDIIKNNIKLVNLKLISEVDLGLFYAMNKAIHIASKKYIIYINSGDELGPVDNIQYAKDVLRLESPDILYGKSNFYSRNIRNGYLVGKKVDLEDFRYSMPICHQSIFCKVDTLKLFYGFNTNFKVAADFDLIIRIFKKSNITKIYIDLVLSKFWIDDFNWKNSPLSYFERYIIVRHHFNGLNIICFLYCIYLSIRYYISLGIKKLFFYEYLRRIKINTLR
jgi:glycosyltransferase involved in cell wall biosynthesis